jgi:hypothetical protein
MNRILAMVIFGCCILSSCHDRSGSGKKDNGLPFSVDTGQLKHLDSVAAAERRFDSVLMKQANGSPGINAGAGKFAIRVPPGWRRVDTSLGNIHAIVLDTASANARFRTNVSIVSDSMRGLSPDKYLSGTINSLATYVPRFSLIGQGVRPLAGDSAHWIHYSQDRGGTDMENICYIITHNDVAYIVTCSALKGRLVESYPAFERTIRSFALR